MARVDRLDLVVGYLEEMRHHGGSARSSTSPSTPTTFSSSSPTSTPRCRPAEDLLRETRAKGSLVERIAFLENRVLKMEEERLEGSSMSMEMMTPERMGSRLSSSMNSAGSGGGSGTGIGRKRKGLKSLVKSCVRGGAKLKISPVDSPPSSRYDGETIVVDSDVELILQYLIILLLLASLDIIFSISLTIKQKAKLEAV